MELTTIQISKQTRDKLNSLRVYRRVTYDEVIDALTSPIPSGDEEGDYTDEFRASLLRSLIDMKNGNAYSSSEAKARLGV